MTWRAVVLALEPPGAFTSRVGIYLHPLAGRSILWHSLRALLDTTPPPSEVVVLHHPDVPVDVSVAPGAVTVAVEGAGEFVELEAQAIRGAVNGPGTTLLVDGAAPLVTSATYERLLRAGEKGIAVLDSSDARGDRLAVAGSGTRLARAEDPRRPTSATRIAAATPEGNLRVADRHSLAAAHVAVRDRLVRLHEARGVSFLLPETVWLDVGVRIGSDTLVYPHVVIEGETEIGAECVIGPFSRLIDATIGRGVELRGWNYVSRAAVRNQAVLEPYVRRGID